jgi:hypothetical protein
LSDFPVRWVCLPTAIMRGGKQKRVEAALHSFLLA